MKPRPADHGFSLLELAISLAVAAVFLAILLPALSTARVSTHRARCAGNQRLLGEAWTHCLEDGGGAFPMIAVQPGWCTGRRTGPFRSARRPAVDLGSRNGNDESTPHCGGREERSEDHTGARRIPGTA